MLAFTVFLGERFNKIGDGEDRKGMNDIVGKGTGGHERLKDEADGRNDEGLLIRLERVYMGKIFKGLATFFRSLCIGRLIMSIPVSF